MLLNRSDWWVLFWCWQDPYGNYVVQYVLGICGREEADILVNVPLGKVTNFPITRTKVGSSIK